jgi:hypothetical protein
MARASSDEEVAPAKIRRRSHAAIPVVLALLVLGLVLGYYAVAVPFLLGVLLVGVLLSFLSIRLNPLGMGFYLPTKPSWSAIGMVFLSAVLLLASSFVFYLDLHAPIIPVPVP